MREFYRGMAQGLSVAATVARDRAGREPLGPVVSALLSLAEDLDAIRREPEDTGSGDLDA